jgi:hypothetical protein
LENFLLVENQLLPISQKKVRPEDIAKNLFSIFCELNNANAHFPTKAFQARGSFLWALISG